VRKFVHDFKTAYPSVPKWDQGVILGCRKHGYVTTSGGRRRPLPGIGSKDKRERNTAERKAVNTVCQVRTF
jgi:DNA polymerase-1